VRNIGLQKMLKSVSFHPETQADMTLHVRHVAASIAGGVAVMAETARTGKEGTWRVFQSTKC
jgi:hypothetical protein